MNFTSAISREGVGVKKEPQVSCNRGRVVKASTRMRASELVVGICGYHEISAGMSRSLRLQRHQTGGVCVT